LPEGQWSRSVLVAFTAVAGQWAPPVQQSVVRSAACEPQQQWLMGLGIEQARPPRGQMPMPLITIETASTAVASLPSTIGPKVTAGYSPVKGGAGGSGHPFGSEWDTLAITVTSSIGSTGLGTCI